MIAIGLLAIFLLLSFYFGKRSLLAGLCVVIAIGYFYGILRANLLGTFSYFLFDAAVLGLFVIHLPILLWRNASGKFRTLKIWVLVLLIWPFLIFLIPVQDFLVQLVGLRGNTFMVPFLLFGALLKEEDLRKFSVWLSILNIIAFGFAAAEYVLGVPVFFPFNPVTEIIYRTKDLVGHTAFRIPSTFGNAHAYAGTMTITLPILVGAWLQKNVVPKHKLLIMTAIAVSLIGVFMSGSRLHFIIASILVITTAFTIRGRFAHSLGWVIIIAGIVWLVSGEEKLQRFTSLRDTDYLIERVKGSVNMTFFELAYQYPVGNGM